MKILHCLPAFLALVLSAAIAHAEKDAALKPLLAKPGKVMVDETFASAELAKPWTVAKGEWKTKEGTLAGSFKESDHHPAVLFLAVPNHSSIIRFSFKMPGNKGFNLSYNSAKGHLFRILVAGDGLTLNKDRDKKDAKSKNAVLAQAAGKITSNEWHTMQVEVLGGKVTVQTDTGLKAEAANNELDVDKTGYRFVTGSSITLGDVKVWQAE